MAKKKVKEIDLRDAGAGEIDLRDRLRFAAGALAADFGDQLTADHAEALVFSSAEGLLASASVTEFVPILAERRARLAVRSAATAPAPSEPVAAPPAPSEPVAAPPAPSEPVVAPPAPPEPVAAPEAAAPAPAAPAAVPLLAVPESQMARLRDTLEEVRARVAGWRAELDRR